MKPRSVALVSVAFSAFAGMLSSRAQHEQEPASSSNAALQMDTVVVTASLLGRTLAEQTQPVNVLSNQELRLRLQPTLGDTLSQQVGISSSYFGPVASRPVIRGLSDERVQILSNGNANIDLSNVSPDHAVAIDPLTIDRVEVVRGPASLLYGPNSIGGVVNVIDSRIAEKQIEPNALGTKIRGAFDGRFNSVDRGGSGSGMIKLGLGPLVVHLDGFRRNSSLLRIPKETHSAWGRANAETESVRGRLPNSASQSDGGAVGASMVWDEGFAGLSYSGMNSEYGAVAERDVSIHLRQRRWDFRGAFLKPFEGIKALNYKFSATDYQHTELEPVGFQTFTTRGYAGRLEMVHEKIGLLEGAFGYQLQISNSDVVSSDLDHLLLPPSRTWTHSAFIFEEIAVDAMRYQFGARWDNTSVQSGGLGDKFQKAARRFNSLSLSAGAVYDWNKDYAIALNTGFTQRPPTSTELFANGAHHATGSYELGYAGLEMERAFTVDLALRKKTGRITGSAGVFYNYFTNFLALSPTGATQEVDDGDESLPVYRFRGTRAALYGAEAEVVFHLIEPTLQESDAAAFRSPGVAADAPEVIQGLHLDLRADYVRSRDMETDRSLPRMTPFRTQAALVHDWNGLHSRIETQYVARQNQTSENESSTASYVLLNAMVSYRLKAGPTRWDIYVRGTNLTNREARVHTSFLKDVAPLPGRGVLLGMRLDF
jgi:iron complex outermembrane receptor protein